MPFDQGFFIGVTDAGLEPDSAPNGVIWATGEGSQYVWVSENGSTWIRSASAIRVTGSEAVDRNAFYDIGKNIAPDPYGIRQLIYNASTNTITETIKNSHPSVGTLLVSQGQSAVFGRYYYRWSGYALTACELAPSVAAAQVYVPYLNGMADPGKELSIFPVDNGVAFSVSWGGGTDVHQYTGYGEQIWYQAGVRGLTCFQSGSIYLAGVSLANTIQLWGMNLQQGVPIQLAEVRPDQTGTFEIMHIAPGLNGTVLILVRNPNNSDLTVFEYHAGQDSMTEVFTKTNSDGDPARIAAGLGKRWVLNNVATVDQFKILEVASDTATPDTSSYELTDSAWNFGTPHDDKTLHAISVLHAPGGGGKNFTIDYQLNESGTWVSLPTQTPASGETKTRVTVSSPSSHIKFRILRPRYRGTLELHQVAFEVEGRAQREMWELVIRLDDERNTNRPSGDQRFAEQKRDSLLTLADSGAPITLLDGYRYKHQDATYSTHNVVVELAEDIIDREAEGRMRIRLRKV